MYEHRSMPRGARPAGWVRVLGAVALAAAGVTLVPAGASAQQTAEPSKDSVAAALSKQLMQTLPTCKVMHQLMQQMTAPGAQISFVSASGGPALVVDSSAPQAVAGKDSIRAVATAVVAVASAAPADTTSASKPGVLVVSGGKGQGVQLQMQVIQENCSAEPKKP